MGTVPFSVPGVFVTSGTQPHSLGKGKASSLAMSHMHMLCRYQITAAIVASVALLPCSQRSQIAHRARWIIEAQKSSGTTLVIRNTEVSSKVVIPSRNLCKIDFDVPLGRTGAALLLLVSILFEACSSYINRETRTIVHAQTPRGSTPHPLPLLRLPFTSCHHPSMLQSHACDYPAYGLHLFIAPYRSIASRS